MTPLHDRSDLAAVLGAGRAALEARVAAAAGPLAALLIDALCVEAGRPGGAPGPLERLAPGHGRFGAREDGSVDAMLRTYAALRAGLLAVLAADGPPASAHAGPMTALHAAIDRAGALAATAFEGERARQGRLASNRTDHVLRGGLNAIRLAVFVRRQNGTDTGDVIERQTGRMRECLDRVRHRVAASTGRALRPADLDPDDLASVCRQAAAAWNDAGRQPRCETTLPEADPVRFDADRLREALDHLLDGAALRAAPGPALRLGLTAHRGLVRLRVDLGAGAHGAADLPSPFDRAPPTEAIAIATATEAAVRRLETLLAGQTARAHGGRLTVADGAHGGAWELTLGETGGSGLTLGETGGSG